MMRSRPDLRLFFRDRQRTRRIDRGLLRRMVRWILAEQLAVPDAEICFHLVAAAEMAVVNETFLHHPGSTDVITFDHKPLLSGFSGAESRSRMERCDAERRSLHGEIYISMDDAVAQARQFGTTWQSELARYAIHGLLHLAGFDDRTPAARRDMKSAENRLLRDAARRFPLARLSQPRAGQPARHARAARD